LAPAENKAFSYSILADAVSLTFWAMTSKIAQKPKSLSPPESQNAKLGFVLDSAPIFASPGNPPSAASCWRFKAALGRRAPAGFLRGSHHCQVPSGRMYHRILRLAASALSFFLRSFRLRSEAIRSR
jgi:hypothetical protein